MCLEMEVKRKKIEYVNKDNKMKEIQLVLSRIDNEQNMKIVTKLQTFV